MAKRLDPFSGLAILKRMSEGIGEKEISRASMLEVAERPQRYDVLVIGGGIHGSTCAYLAARAGLRVLLLERGDFASGTASRSSKMAHGGLRYLEMFDFEQVFEGIKAREVLFERAPHLVHPAKFLVPVFKNDWIFRAKLKVGLTLYDLMVRNRGHKHRYISRQDLNGAIYNASRSDLMGCFEYTDGIMNDSRLVVEMVVAAANAGAICLNHANVVELRRTSPGSVEWVDNLSGRSHEATFDVAINCAGPWAPHLLGVEPRSVVRYSQGTHLLFSRQWVDPAVFLPIGEKGRYYWVWPHATGAMVGTTEREVDEPVEDPVPFIDEVDEILERLKRDVPSAGLDRSTLCYAFAGTRTLPLRPGEEGQSSQLSRKHIWRSDGSVVTLIGGKYTTFHWTAREGITRAAAMLNRPISEESLAFPILPNLRSRSSIGRLPTEKIADDVARCVRNEMAGTLDDIMRYRLDLELSPDQGISLLPSVAAVLEPVWGSEVVTRQVAAYRAKVERIKQLLGLSRNSVS